MKEQIKILLSSFTNDINDYHDEYRKENLKISEIHKEKVMRRRQEVFEKFSALFPVGSKLYKIGAKELQRGIFKYGVQECTIVSILLIEIRDVIEIEFKDEFGKRLPTYSFPLHIGSKFKYYKDLDVAKNIANNKNLKSKKQLEDLLNEY